MIPFPSYPLVGKSKRLTKKIRLISLSEKSKQKESRWLSELHSIHYTKRFDSCELHTALLTAETYLAREFKLLNP